MNETKDLEKLLRTINSISISEWNRKENSGCYAFETVLNPCAVSTQQLTVIIGYTTPSTIRSGNNLKPDFYTSIFQNSGTRILNITTQDSHLSEEIRKNIEKTYESLIELYNKYAESSAEKAKRTYLNELNNSASFVLKAIEKDSKGAGKNNYAMKT